MEVDLTPNRRSQSLITDLCSFEINHVRWILNKVSHQNIKKKNDHLNLNDSFKPGLASQEFFFRSSILNHLILKVQKEMIPFNDKHD